MARLAVLTDRHPDDSDWKGAYIWQLILSLAQSQHDVTVFTTLDPSTIEFSHPRLTIARPAKSFRMDRLMSWLQALMTFKPDVIHTFALKKNALWPAVSVWPYLHSAFAILPRVQRVCTLFEFGDLSKGQSSAPWVMGAHRWTLFTTAQKATLQREFRGDIDVAPMDLPQDWSVRQNIIDVEIEAKNISTRLLIPSPVSNWRMPMVDLCLLADFLQNHRDVTIEIIGGWGDFGLSQKREGWSILQKVSHQVEMSAALSLQKFSARVQTSQGLWLRSLTPESWVYFVSAQLAQHFSKPVYGVKPQLAQGSNANFLSRLYSSQ